MSSVVVTEWPPVPQRSWTVSARRAIRRCPSCSLSGRAGNLWLCRLGRGPGFGLALAGLLGSPQLLGDGPPLSPCRLAAPQGVLNGEQFLVADRQAVCLADHAR